MARIAADDGLTLGTVVNYACHPTTLAWQNTLISPDYVGALREVVERATEAPCLFLQGASGDLGPREGFVGDAEVADAQRPAGRLCGAGGPGVAAAAADEVRLCRPGRFRRNPGHLAVRVVGTCAPARSAWRSFTVDLPYRADLPALAADSRATRSLASGGSSGRVRLETPIASATAARRPSA